MALPIGVHRMLVLLILLASLLCGIAVSGVEPKSPPYKRVVPIGTAIARDGALCIDFVGSMTSGNFFEGLEPMDTDAGRRFYSGHREITEFPEELTVEIKARVVDCSVLPPHPVNDETARKLASVINFKVDWKKGLQQRPVEGFSLKVFPPEPAPMSELAPDPEVWTYLITVESKNVPITDHVIVSITSGSGKLLTRLSGHV
jgi:hypothetical protein